MEVTRKKLAEQIEEEATTNGGDEVVSEGPFVPSGSTLLNLACSDSIEGAFALGGLVNIIGDSQAGKSLLALSILAECCSNPIFKDYKLIYDDVEEANSFDMENLFGNKLVDRLEAPLYVDDLPVYSNTIQDFHMHINRLVKEGAPFIYILDSFDALTSDEEISHVEGRLDAREKGKEAKGSYGMDKPKAMSQMLRMVKGSVKRTKSFVGIISQTRDDINPMTFTKKTRSGGNALRFYSWHEMWLAISGKIKGKRDIPIGVNTKIKVSKNKITGKLREVEFPIYYSLGISDTESCINWLVEYKFWGKSGAYIAPQDWETLSKDKFYLRDLIKEIEDNNLEKSLANHVGMKWKEVEDELKLERKKRYE
jgi:recombination protein RecA